ncbi:hypothetical protein [Gudongella oleilytica]|jgi:hypothetical protein|uniref:hypothetical protein n=1 Tax=Gudongella oleilytica TaxID=1582259 RepID=UPI000EB86FF1|nr:hypothetical protein [Gudongella oleilytica]MDY0256913.1 hypothetical protein [Gudongella oleilytica]HCO19376.1 hypothetical protein [Tissierellales bacterium]
MALTNDTFCDLYEGLKHNFLFKNDLNSIHILLNLYDIEDNIRNIFPKYVSIKFLKNSITRILKERRGNQLIALNLGELLHEDINRLELLLYLEGYKDGFINIKEANKLEDLTVKTYPINELYYQKYLFHFESGPDNVEAFKEEVFSSLEQQEEESGHIINLIEQYCDKIIRAKVYSLNKYLDKQLTINYSDEYTHIAEDDSLLTLDELSNIYMEVVKIINRNGMRLYKDAYWNGLNDRVLKRYR